MFLYDIKPKTIKPYNYIIILKYNFQSSKRNISQFICLNIVNLGIIWEKHNKISPKLRVGKHLLPQDKQVFLNFWVKGLWAKM